MANIPSIQRSSLLYTRLRRQGQKKLLETEETADETRNRVKSGERRHSTERRRKNIKVLFNRRKKTDRRNSARIAGGRMQAKSGNETPDKGNTINTTA